MRNSANINRGASAKRPWIAGVLAVLVLVLMAGCVNGPGGSPGSANDPVVATANGANINTSDVVFLMSQAQQLKMWDYFEMFGDFEIDFDREFRDGATFGRAVREEAVRLAAFVIMYEEYAGRLGVTLTSENIAMVDDHMDMLLEVHGEEELQNMILEEGFRGQSHLAEFLGSQLLLDNLMQEILDNPTEFARFEQYMQEEEEQQPAIELMGAKHILANFENFDSEDEAETFANELLERALAGEDFDALVAEYGQDPGMWNFPQGYSFASGFMVPEFEQTTRELEIGEISGLVRSTFGFHIIMRVEPNMDDWYALQGISPRTLEQQMAEAIFIGLEAMADDMEIVFLPALDDVPIE